jgi:uncharacterized protein YbbC (DUF1343 family)
MHQGLRVVGVALFLAAALGAGRETASGDHRRRAVRQAARVLPGVDVLFTDSAHLVAGRRVGLLTNQSGLDRAGVPTIDRMARAPGVRLVALFAPEHGIRGVARPGEAVADTMDPATGIPIYSLYGARRGAPGPEQLAALDVLVVDLQDAGTRTWTYVTTTIASMRAAQAAGKPIVVLDRPNPIGCTVQGPVLDTALRSAIGPLPVPLRHGMTMGELARFANGELGIGADLHVVPVKGWRRCDWLDATGLPFVRPSPNLTGLDALSWYPGTVLFEATNLSTGRGSDAPFSQVGAPWLDARRVADAMADRYGVTLLPVRFTPVEPGDGKFAGVSVAGVRLPAADRAHGDPVREALRLLQVIAELQPESLRIDSLGLARRLGVRASINAPRWADAVRWTDAVRDFMVRRRPYLLYRERVRGER